MMNMVLPYQCCMPMAKGSLCPVATFEFCTKKTNLCFSSPLLLGRKMPSITGSSSKKTHFYIKKTNSKKYLENGGVLGSMESFFFSEISFYREFKKLLVQQEINKDAFSV
jgi:hypothetical protein